LAQEAADAKINALSTELKLLRKGLGVQAKNLPGVVGEELRAVCGIREDDNPGTVRARVVATLLSLIEKLPEPQRETARIVLGFGTGANERYTARLELLGSGADRNIRTMQRAPTTSSTSSPRLPTGRRRPTGARRRSARVRGTRPRWRSG